MIDVGRPRKILDASLVEQLAKAQLTNVEIASICGCEEKTLTRRFGERLKSWKSHGVGSVRKRLFDKAMSNDRQSVTAAIFFLKNYGDMKDVVEGKVGGTVKHEHEHTVVDLSKLSDADLEAVEKLINSATAQTADAGRNQG